MRPMPGLRRIELTFTSAFAYPNPLQDAALGATFTSPAGRTHRADGFWDGGLTWRVRFRPTEAGRWTYTTHCSDNTNEGLHGRAGAFDGVAAGTPGTRFQQHGPVGLAENRRYFAYMDGTPFLWLGDTGWNGALRATDDEWTHYARERARQGFTGSQWVATHWFVSPDGDRDGQRAFSGHERFAVNPAFFQRLDGRLEVLNQAGLLAAPAMLWASRWREPDVGAVNPGLSLPEEQAVLLARYMLARWHAHDVMWILNGDGDYLGEKAERWRNIGRAVFGSGPHAPTTLHPRGMQLMLDEFRDEGWLDIIGYQSGHGDSEETLRWLTGGPPATRWREEPPRPFINLEPPYENHIAYHSRRPHSPLAVRRALYWSLLVAPVAGVTYGGHGVWGWDDGSGPPTAHPDTGTPLPWREALRMPAAEHMAHLAALFGSIEWWRLRPAPDLLARQPGEADARRFCAAACAEDNTLAVVYVPEDRRVELRADRLAAYRRAQWHDPRTGEREAAHWPAAGPAGEFNTPGPGDWVLVLEA